MEYEEMKYSGEAKLSRYSYSDHIRVRLFSYIILLELSFYFHRFDRQDCAKFYGHHIYGE